MTSRQALYCCYVSRFVLCEKCDNPETVIKVYAKKQTISASCKACGHYFMLDMRHKLSTFILRNPPEQDLNNQGTSITKRQVKIQLFGIPGNDVFPFFSFFSHCASGVP